jgi:hypothetical protein
LRDRDGTDVVERRPGSREGFLDDAADIPDVLPGGELRNDAAPFAMDRGLGRDDVRANRPRTLPLSGLGNDGRRRLVARRFDGEDVQETASKALRSASEYGGRMMPVSVMIPAMYRCGVTSKAGLRMFAPSGVRRDDPMWVISRSLRSSIGI